MTEAVTFCHGCKFVSKHKTKTMERCPLHGTPLEPLFISTYCPECRDSEKLERKAEKIRKQIEAEEEDMFEEDDEPKPGRTPNRF